MSARRPALLARFPHFLPTPPSNGSAPDATLLVTDAGVALNLEEAMRAFPLLAPELEHAQAIIVPYFRECDAFAAREQNRHRRQQVLLIIGGSLAASLGAIQAVLTDSVWPGIAVATVAAATGAVASVARQSGALDRYLVHRLRAERLRSLYFTSVVGASERGARSRAELRQQAVEVRFGAS